MAIHGLMLWDVEDPTDPVELGFYDSGCCTGVHEFEIESGPTCSARSRTPPSLPGAIPTRIPRAESATRAAGETSA